MSTIKSNYGTSNQSITCTITSLSDGSGRQSAAVDNTSNLFLDALVQLKVKTGGSGASGTGRIEVYAYGTADGGSNYSGGATGSDAAYTLPAAPNVKLIGVMNTAANSTTYVAGPFSVAAAFGGVLPDHWGLVIQNFSGTTLDGTTANAIYQGILASVV